MQIISFLYYKEFTNFVARFDGSLLLDYYMSDSGSRQFLVNPFKTFKQNNFMARKKQEIILENVVIEAVAAEGKALAKVDGAVLFVQFAVPGNVVDVKVVRRGKVRRAKLYYLRDRVGKAARVKERI